MPDRPSSARISPDTPVGELQCTGTPAVTAAPWALGPRARAGQRVHQGFRPAEHLGGLDDAPHADAGAEHGHLGRPRDQRLDGGGQLATHGHRVGADGGTVQDGRAPPLQHGDLLGRTAVGGHPDQEPRHLLQRHRAMLAAPCCPDVSGSLPASSRSFGDVASVTARIHHGAPLRM